MMQAIYDGWLGLVGLTLGIAAGYLLCQSLKADIIKTASGEKITPMFWLKVSVVGIMVLGAASLVL